MVLGKDRGSADQDVNLSLLSVGLVNASHSKGLTDLLQCRLPVVAPEDKCASIAQTCKDFPCRYLG